LFAGFFSIAAVSQRTIEKAWEAHRFQKLEVVSNQVYHIKLVPQKANKIKLLTTIQGENAENIVVPISEANNTLTITTAYRPFYDPKNDKLAAHKVISIEMVVYLPEAMEVFIEANIASVECRGAINNLSVNLRDGNCFLYDFEGNAHINTREGTIAVWASSQVAGRAISRHGEIKNELPEKGKYSLYAESVNGMISLLKSPE